ncbi:S-methyl-5'-thioinosine phosphorylase [Candidatus Woesearchaeota archaeon]|nr:S-methyl-5'-thioinosine phosphorylase [Candidatus Woesearchaeota archaeon]
MKLTGIIGGTGLTHLDGLHIKHRETVDTPYGSPSSALVFGSLQGQALVFLARHGDPHTIAPHRVNYRANLWALHAAGVDSIIAVAAVGGIDRLAEPGRVVIPDQIIDYTSNRVHTLYDDSETAVTHIDFSHPYTPAVRTKLLTAAQRANVPTVDGGVYGCTQGPRLETIAEIRRMQQDGCTLVGMTGMPEAALARELGIPYACCAVVANRAAGLSDSDEITMEEIHANLVAGMNDVHQILKHLDHAHQTPAG